MAAADTPAGAGSALPEAPAGEAPTAPDAAPSPRCPVDHAALADPAPPRGSRLHPVVQLVRSLRDPVGFTHRQHRRFGDVFAERSLVGTSVSVADPAVVEAVFAGPHDALHAGAANGIFLKAIFGRRGILAVDGEEHTATRKRLLPPFRGKEIARYRDIMREETERRIATWPVGAEVRVHEEARAITLEVILRTVFGAQTGPELDELREAVSDAAHITLVRGMWLVAPRLGAVPPWRSYARLVARTNALLDKLIAERRAAPDLAERTDTLSLLIRGEAEGAHDDEWLRNQLMSLLGAGHETTTTSLSWAVELLSRHPDVREKARTGDDEYLDAVINETLRLRTVLPGVGRRLSRRMSLGGYTFDEGTMLNPQIEAIHTDPRIWGDAEVFRPERFLAHKPATNEFLPYGGGKRRCIGALFAHAEMKVALRTILDTMDFTHVGDGAETQKHSFVTLVPSRGALIRRTR